VAKQQPKSKPGPKPDPSRVRVTTTMVRSSEAWKTAVESLAEFDRCSSVSELIDRAVAQYARHVGYNRAIPMR
jgi:hypothetical protein